jgi:hypothetical protein
MKFFVLQDEEYMMFRGGDRMTFEEEYPSLKGQDGEEGYYHEDSIRAACIDKQRGISLDDFRLLKKRLKRNLWLRRDKDRPYLVDIDYVYKEFDKFFPSPEKSPNTVRDANNKEGRAKARVRRSPLALPNFRKIAHSKLLKGR